MSTLLHLKQKNKEQKRKQKPETVPHTTIDQEMLTNE